VPEQQIRNPQQAFSLRTGDDQVTIANTPQLELLQQVFKFN